jgi:hypothetical protein
MSDLLSPLLNALDRLDHLPAPPRCVQPDWSAKPDVRRLQALCADYLGHHVPATWAETVGMQLCTPVTPAASPTVPRVRIEGAKKGGARQYTGRQWLMFGASWAGIVWGVFAWHAHPAAAPVMPSTQQAQDGGPSGVPLTSELAGAPRYQSYFTDEGWRRFQAGLKSR